MTKSQRPQSDYLYVFNEYWLIFPKTDMLATITDLGPNFRIQLLSEERHRRSMLDGPILINVTYFSMDFILNFFALHLLILIFYVEQICRQSSQCNDPFGSCSTAGEDDVGKCICITGYSGINCENRMYYT